MLRAGGGDGVEGKNVVTDGVWGGGMQSGGGCEGGVRLKWSAERYIRNFCSSFNEERSSQDYIF